jgi:hypothetical protein
MNEQWVVGPEHDERLFRRLGTVLKGMGYDLGPTWHGVGGSQEISHWELTSVEGALVVKSETYVGLSVEGPAELVLRVRRQFEATNAPESIMAMPDPAS